MKHIVDHNSLISHLGGAPKIAEFLKIKPVNVRQWMLRNRIPPEHWQELSALSSESGFAVDANWLVDTMPPRKAVDVAA